jgi:hypothetical protein
MNHKVTGWSWKRSFPARMYRAWQARKELWKLGERMEIWSLGIGSALERIDSIPGGREQYEIWWHWVVRGVRCKSLADVTHENAMSVLEDAGRLIAPVIPRGWRWSVWVDPGADTLKYWTGNVTAEQWQDLVWVRLGRELEKQGMTYEQYLEEGIKRRKEAEQSK